MHTDHQKTDTPTGRLACCWGPADQDWARQARHTLEPSHSPSLAPIMHEWSLDYKRPLVHISLTMSKIQSKITRHQTMWSILKRQSMETDTDMTQLLELADKDLSHTVLCHACLCTCSILCLRKNLSPC